MSRYWDTSTETPMPEIIVQHGKIQSFFVSEICKGHPQAGLSWRLWCLCDLKGLRKSVSSGGERGAETNEGRGPSLHLPKNVNSGGALRLWGCPSSTPKSGFQGFWVKSSPELTFFLGRRGGEVGGPLFPPHFCQHRRSSLN